jgi:hypothetical protein
MAYQTFPSVAAAKKAFRRMRTAQHFILEGGTANPKCGCCGKRVNDFSGTDVHGKELHPTGFRSTRCTYYPSTKSVKTMHYTCAWGGVLAQAAVLRA